MSDDLPGDGYREARRQLDAPRDIAELLVGRRQLWQERAAERGTRTRKYPEPFEVVAPSAVDIPEGWRWVTVSHLAFLDVGFAFKSAEFQDQGIRLLRGENVEPGSLRWTETRYWPKSRVEEVRHLLVEPGEIILALDRPIVAAGLKLARVKPTDVPALLVQRVMRFKMVTATDAPYLYWCLFHHRFIDFLAHDGMTGSDLPHITGTGVAEFPIPVPPPRQQSAIVRQIEVLLGQVDRAKGRLAQVPLILERFRQAVLAAACSGDLTTEWRDEHPSWQDDATDFKSKLAVAPRGKNLAEPAEAELDVPDGWPVVSLAAIATHLTSGSRAWSPYYRDDGFGTFVMAQNVRPMRFDQSHRQGVAPPANDPERLRTTVHEGDILVTIVGANTGDVCRVDVPVRDHFVCQSVALARLTVPAFAPFLELWLNSVRHGQWLYQEWAYGEGRPHLSFDQLRSTPIAIPGQPEQSEILRRVSNLFALADTIERRVQAATARADRLPQAVLSKAFSGELVPTEAELARAEGWTYETAKEPLARVTAAGAPAPMKQRASPTSRKPAGRRASR